MNEIAGTIQDSELEVMRVLWEAGEALPIQCANNRKRISSVVCTYICQ